MHTKEFNKNAVINKIDSFSGLAHIGNGNNKDIEAYYRSFMDWLDQNNVLAIIDQYANVQMNLNNVTPHDFLIWLLHYGDVYDNLLRYCLKVNSNFDYKDYAIEFYNLRKLHPKFSFTVALSSQMMTNRFLSDNDITSLTNLLITIPDNSNKSQRVYQTSSIGNGLFDALHRLSNFATERVTHS